MQTAFAIKTPDGIIDVNTVRNNSKSPIVGFVSVKKPATIYLKRFHGDRKKTWDYWESKGYRCVEIELREVKK